MAVTGTLALPDGSRAKVYRAIVAILKADPVLKRVFGSNWSVMSGDPDDVADLSEAEAPAIVLMPSLGPMSWWSPDAFIGPLAISFEVLIDGLNASDVLNLQDAIERALYPADHDAAHAQERALVALGAETGQADFAMPVNDDGKGWGANQQHLRGQIIMQVKRSINN
jgi:hypothetical protein